MELLLQLALIDDDPATLLLAVNDIRRRKKDISPKFNFESYETARFVEDFRFTRLEIIRLLQLFKIPEEMKARNGIVFSGKMGKLWLTRKFEIQIRETTYVLFVQDFVCFWGASRIQID